MLTDLLREGGDRALERSPSFGSSKRSKKRSRGCCGLFGF